MIKYKSPSQPRSEAKMSTENAKKKLIFEYAALVAKQMLSEDAEGAQNTADRLTSIEDELQMTRETILREAAALVIRKL